jgi:hypothetical protein
LKSSRALASSPEASSNTAGEIRRSKCASRISLPVYSNGPPAQTRQMGSLPRGVDRGRPPGGRSPGSPGTIAASCIRCPSLPRPSCRRDIRRFIPSG